MDKKSVQKARSRRIVAGKLLLWWLPFLVAGFLVASGFHGPNQSIANVITEGSHVVVTEPPTMPSSFAELAEKLSPTVVNIKVTKIEKAAFQGSPFQNSPYDDFFGKFFQEGPQGPKEYKAHGAGSGVIISEDGYILSNNHVVEDAEEVTVTLADKKEYKAKVMGCDPKTDLAMLKIVADRSLPAAGLGSSKQLNVGDWVVAIGNPFGLNHTVTSGIVSAKGRVIGAGPYDDFIQTDASINPGNSGGPLFNMSGELVGINTAIIPQGQGIGFAIPIDMAKPLIPQLESNGEIIRGYLGVNIQNVTPDIAKALDAENAEGALVADVVSGSPADKGGVERGDIITVFDGQDVKTSQELPFKVAATPVDEEVKVTVLRDGKEHQLTVKVGKLLSDETRIGISSQPEKGTWGLQLHDLSPEIGQQLHLQAEQGVAIVGVEPGSAADDAGIQRGDVIVEVNRHPVNSISDVKENINKSEDKDHLLLLVQRQTGKLYIPLELKG